MQKKTYITVFSRIESAVQSANQTRVYIALREKPVTQVKKKTYEEQEAAHLTTTNIQ